MPSANPGHTCLKGRYAFHFYNHPDRLRTPLIRATASFEQATWDEAYDHIADDAHPDQRGVTARMSIAGISSARCTNEENYLMQKFIRAVIGTNNIDCCARVCHSPTALGMQKTFGTGAATNSVADLEHTNCILVIGANPTEAHPVTGARIKQRVMKGVPLIVIDPRRIELAQYATYHLQLRPGTNVALLNMMLYYIISDGLVDQEFIDHRTEGLGGIQEGHPASWTSTSRRRSPAWTGNSFGRPPRLATRPPALPWDSTASASPNTRRAPTPCMLIADLAMMTGNIGRPGVGVNPLRGQNNVQGAADMGCQPHQGAGYLRCDDSRSPPAATRTSTARKLSERHRA